MSELTFGIDIGGTNTKFGIVDRKGKVLFNDRVRTREFETIESLIDQVAQALRDGMHDLGSNDTLVGIGVGAPNGNFLTGTIENAPNLKWKGSIPLTTIIKKIFNVPVMVTNDANAAAVGEMIFGSAKGMKDFIVITLGTGLGSGIVCNGLVLNGKHGMAGELGHTFVNPGVGRQCNCGKRGCLETYVSATGIKRTVYKLLADSLDDSELRDVSFDQLSTKMITAAAQRGDKVACEAFAYTGRILGMKLSDSVVHTDPEAIFLLGGLSLAGDFIFEPTIKHMEATLMPIFRGKVKILPSGLPNQVAPILGASSLVWNYLEQHQGIHA
ncbi:MAG TPA: ROK family protein [Cyclobacteriaceae bacterium]